MAKKWIYLYEDEKINTNDIKDQTGVDAKRKELTDRSEELKRERSTLAGQVKTNLVNTKDNIVNQRKLKQHEKNINAKNNNPQVQQGVAAGTASSSLLDEEKEDASIKDNTSKDDFTKEMKQNPEESIKNEKQPLQEFVDFFKIFKNQ